MKSKALVPYGGIAARPLVQKAEMPSHVRNELRVRRPLYRYANGILPATFEKFVTWRQTGEPGVFYLATMNDGITGSVERYVWVYRNGVMVEVEQFGIRHGRRQFMGWSS